MVGHPKVDIHGILVFFWVELQPSLEPDFRACDGHLAGEAHELQFPNRSCHHGRPGPEKAQANYHRGYDDFVPRHF
jgi:hypothetical protein